MRDKRARFVATLIAAFLLAHAAQGRAQAVEVTPFGGYRFGGHFFEIVSGRPVDLDGAPALGLVVDVPLANGLQFEGAFSRQQADVVVPTYLSGLPAQLQVSVDHWQGGALQEYAPARARVRPFAVGVMGLTRYAAGGDSELRLAAGGGGGVKLFPFPYLAVRLDGRVFATLIDADGTAMACVNGRCLLALHVDVAWQAEFTAGIVVKLP